MSRRATFWVVAGCLTVLPVLSLLYMAVVWIIVGTLLDLVSMLLGGA